MRIEKRPRGEADDAGPPPTPGGVSCLTRALARRLRIERALWYYKPPARRVRRLLLCLCVLAREHSFGHRSESTPQQKRELNAHTYVNIHTREKGNRKVARVGYLGTGCIEQNALRRYLSGIGVPHFNQHAGGKGLYIAVEDGSISVAVHCNRRFGVGHAKVGLRDIGVYAVSGSGHASTPSSTCHYCGWCEPIDVARIDADHTPLFDLGKPMLQCGVEHHATSIHLYAMQRYVNR